MGVQGKVIQKWKVFVSVIDVRDDRVSANVEVEHVTISRYEGGSELFGNAYVGATLLCSEWRVSGGAEKLTEGVHAPGAKPYAGDVGG